MVEIGRGMAIQVGSKQTETLQLVNLVIFCQYVAFILIEFHSILGRKGLTENQRCDCPGREQHQLRRLLLSHIPKCNVVLTCCFVKIGGYKTDFTFFNIHD